MLLDREGERQELDRLLAAVKDDGLSGALVLRGDAGIGKTALLEYAIASATDMRVAHVVGVESEMELTFAGLHQLLAPFLDGLEALPAPQRDALRSAFGLVGGVAADLFLVGLATLTLLANAAAQQPVLCVFDDAQWIDQASAAALGFVARRLFAERVAILFGIREGADIEARFEGLSEMHVRGLPEREARELLLSVATAVPDERLTRRIIAETNGNPLALVELGHELASGELASASRSPVPLPLGSRLEDSFLRRVRELPAHAQTLLLLAAADSSGESTVMWQAAQMLGLTPEAADASLLERLLVLEPRIAFRHPLIRSAVYYGATPRERRQAHEALATASDPELDADRRAWHLAEAAAGPDELVAAELERCAERARRRGGYAATAAFLGRAAELSADEQRRAARRLHAAHAELAGGAPAVAAELLEQALPALADTRDRAQARRLEARVRFALGECRTIPALLLEQAQALKSVDVPLARETLAEAIEVALHAGRDAGTANTRAIARAVRETPRAPETRETHADLLLDGIALLDVDYSRAARMLGRAIRRLVYDDASGAVELAKYTDLGFIAARELQDDDAAQRLSSGVLKRARERGDLMAMLPAFGSQVNSEVLSGRFASAQAALAGGRDISAATGMVGVFGSNSIIELALLVWRGEESRAREAAAATTREALERGMGGHVIAIQAHLTTLELALGNYQAARDCARRVHHEDPIYFGTAILPDLIEASARSDERAAAAAALERLSERSLASGTDLALGMLARSRALLADDRSAEKHHREAIGRLERSATAPELARAHLVYGEWLRRRRRRRDARNELHIAHAMFDSMGAAAFAQRAHVELLATGEHARRRAVETRDVLTPQEERIARLAATGASNHDIAAQMFISPSTVAYHLRKVFRKLGVHNRACLTQAFAGQRHT